MWKVERPHCKKSFTDACQGSLDPIRSFALSGLMLAVGFIKMKDQVQSLMVIAVGLICLRPLLARILIKICSE
ncbi:MAG: hypothetical protein CM15mP39_08580 [Synechococcus sp.]|nr:MAG: hypothetical protein CM15mP39_08580 [Synechococcus sp.]